MPVWYGFLDAFLYHMTFSIIHFTIHSRSLRSTCAELGTRGVPAGHVAFPTLYAPGVLTQQMFVTLRGVLLHSTCWVNPWLTPKVAE